MLKVDVDIMGLIKQSPISNSKLDSFFFYFAMNIGLFIIGHDTAFFLTYNENFLLVFE